MTTRPRARAPRSVAPPEKAEPKAAGTTPQPQPASLARRTRALLQRLAPFPSED